MHPEHIFGESVMLCWLDKVGENGMFIKTILMFFPKLNRPDGKLPQPLFLKTVWVCLLIKERFTLTKQAEHLVPCCYLQTVFWLWLRGMKDALFHSLKFKQFSHDHFCCLHCAVKEVLIDWISTVFPADTTSIFISV